MQGSPFAPTTITATDIQKISDKMDNLQTTLLARIDELEKKVLPALISSTSTVLPTTGLSNMLPAPMASTDLSSIFPKEGGSRRKKRRSKNKGKSRK
jgi:hypothetical protein